MEQGEEILSGARRFVERLAPAPVCGACVTGRLDSASENAVAIALNELAVEPGFARERDLCSLCGAAGHLVLKRR